MSNRSSQQNGVVQSYIDGATAECKQKLKEFLQSASVEDRFRLLRNERGVKYVSWSLLHEAALVGDVENMICMLNGFTSHQTYEVLKGQNTSGSTALHIVAYRGHNEILKLLLDRLTSQQLLNILKLQNYRGNTLLHEAANGNHISTFRHFLSSVSPDQWDKLLNIKNKNDQCALHLATPELAQSYAGYSTQAIAEKTKKLSEQEQALQKLAEKCAELERCNKEQDQVIAENTRMLEEQEQALQQFKCHNERQVCEMERMAARQEEMQRVIEHLEIYIQTPFLTDATGDQEHEELDEQLLAEY